MRLCGKWNLKETILNGASIPNNADIEFEYDKNGKYIVNNKTASVILEGSWEFINSKSNLKITLTSPSPFTYDLTILRLTNKELWVSDITDPNNKFTYKYKAE